MNSRQVCFCAAAAAAALAAVVSRSLAGDPVPCAPPPPPVIEKTVTNRQVLLVPHEQATTLPKLALREVEVGRLPGGPVLDFVEKKCTVTEMELKSCEVEQKVVVTESKPVKVTCPTTGQCRTEYVPCQVEKVVKVKVYKPVPVCREVVIRVPVLKQGPDLVVTKLALDATTVPAIATKYSAVQSVSECKVAVPKPCLPPLPPPPPPCPSCLPRP